MRTAVGISSTLSDRLGARHPEDDAWLPLQISAVGGGMLSLGENTMSQHHADHAHDHTNIPSEPALRVTDCNPNRLRLQLSHFWDWIMCIYHPCQDHIICL